MLRGNECNAVPHQARAAYRFPWPSLALLSTDRNWLMLVMNRSADTVSAKILTQDHASNTGTRTPSQAVLRPSLVRSFVFFLELMQRKPPMLVGSLQHSWRRPPGSAAIGAELASCFTLVQEAYSRFAERNLMPCSPNLCYPSPRFGRKLTGRYWHTYGNMQLNRETLHKIRRAQPAD